MLRPPAPPAKTSSAPAAPTTKAPDAKALREKARKARKEKPARKKDPKDKKAAREKKPHRIPSIGMPSLPSLPHPDIGGGLSRARHAVTDRVEDAFFAVIDSIADGWHWLIHLRLPHLSPLRGSAITGTLVGLLSVLFGWGFYLLFSATRGTSAGGGWGFLAIVFVAFVAFIAGELLLSGFGVPLARVISILSILLALLVVLVFFVKLVAGLWAWLIIPAVTSLAFVASSVLMRVASQEKNDQRLPWEPTSESHINLD